MASLQSWVIFVNIPSFPTPTDSLNFSRFKAAGSDFFSDPPQDRLNLIEKSELLRFCPKRLGNLLDFFLLRSMFFFGFLYLLLCYKISFSPSMDWSIYKKKTHWILWGLGWEVWYHGKSPLNYINHRLSTPSILEGPIILRGVVVS